MMPQLSLRSASVYSLERCSGLPESLAGACSFPPLLPWLPLAGVLSLPKKAAGMCRLWILPVAPLGSLSVMKICSGTCQPGPFLMSQLTLALMKGFASEQLKLMLHVEADLQGAQSAMQVWPSIVQSMLMLVNAVN